MPLRLASAVAERIEKTAVSSGKNFHTVHSVDCIQHLAVYSAADSDASEF